MSTKPFPAPGQVWTFAGFELAPPSGPHTIENLRWFHGAAEAMFEDGSVASIQWMMELDAWQHVDTRPDNLAELARLTAIELRKRGIRALTQGFENEPDTWIVIERDTRLMKPWPLWMNYVLTRSQFGNLGPIACANVIQAEEAKRATEWAGDT